VTMTPDEADRAIAEEIGRCDAPLRPAMRKLADLMSRTEQSVDWLRALRIDGFLALPVKGTIEVDGERIILSWPKDQPEP
jgi:hypothetical protein